jgi:hypothetical protein
MLLGPPICHLHIVLFPPPVALRNSHFDFNQEFRGRQYAGCGNDWLSKYVYAAANFAKTCAWGGWLRAAENFSLDDEDV